MSFRTMKEVEMKNLPENNPADRRFNISGFSPESSVINN